MLTALLCLVGSAFAVDPAAPLTPWTFVLGDPPANLSPNCRVGENTKPFFIAPGVVGRREPGKAQVWDGDPNHGGHLVMAKVGDMLMSVIPAATVMHKDSRGLVTETSPVRFWYCLSEARQDYNGIMLSGPSTFPTIDNGAMIYLGTFLQAGACGNMWIDAADPQHQHLQFNGTRCH